MSNSQSVSSFLLTVILSIFQSQIKKQINMNNQSSILAIFFLFIIDINQIQAGCTASSSAKCVGSCNWNFVGLCCYEKDGPNCYNSQAFITTQPTIDTSEKIGIPSPGNSESTTGTVKQIPMQNNPPPAFVPSSTFEGGPIGPGGIGLMNNLPAGAGTAVSPQSQGAFSKRLRFLRR